MKVERIANPSKAELLFKRRQTQIKLAYEARLTPGMSKAARRALEDERTRQLALARAEFTRLSHAKVAVKKAAKKYVIKKPPVFKRGVIKAIPPRKTRQIPVGGIAHMIDTSGRRRPPKRETMPVSEHWTYFDRDGAPSSPWDLPAGPQFDDDDEDQPDSETPFESGEVFADEDYSYADIEADWGGYDHQDTGYADENA